MAQTAETYELIFQATPDVGSGLDLSLTIVDPSDGAPIMISGNAPTPLTGDFFGYRTRVDTGLGGSGVLAATFDKFSLVSELNSLSLLIVAFCGLGLVRRRRSTE